MKKKELIVLVHGFCRTSKDMLPLSNNLKELAYQTHSVNLPTTFKTLDDCYLAFKTQFEALELEDFDAVHLVGHSMGGLIIRVYLSRHQVDKLGRCVLIATPNQGTRLADIGAKIPFGARILKPILALISEAEKIPPPLNHPSPEFAVIAGDDHRMITGPFLAKPNDGRVEVEATKMEESLMKAFIVLNFIHTKIHDQKQTAKLVDDFLQKGRFVE